MPAPPQGGTYGFSSASLPLLHLNSKLSGRYISVLQEVRAINLVSWASRLLRLGLRRTAASKVPGHGSLNGCSSRTGLAVVRSPCRPCTRNRTGVRGTPCSVHAQSNRRSAIWHTWRKLRKLGAVPIPISLSSCHDLQEVFQSSPRRCDHSSHRASCHLALICHPSLLCLSSPSKSGRFGRVKSSLRPPLRRRRTSLVPRRHDEAALAARNSPTSSECYIR